MGPPDDPATLPADETYHFLRLHPELRNEVYSLVISAPKGCATCRQYEDHQVLKVSTSVPNSPSKIYTELPLPKPDLQAAVDTLRRI
jgi:hypothetical protein